MNEGDKYQTELIIKKMNKIKAFKERVLHIKEEEFKNSSLNKANINNIKIINNKGEKSRNKRDKSEKSYKKNRLKLITKKDLSIYIDNKENRSPKISKIKFKDKSPKYTQLSDKEKNEIRKGRFFSKNYNSHKNIKTNRTVQIRPVNKIQIDSNLGPIKKQQKDNDNKKTNNDTYLNEKEKNIEKQKEKILEKETKIEKKNEEIIEMERKLDNQKEKEIIERLSRPKGLSVSYKKTNNTIIEEDEKNNSKDKDKININIINIQKKVSNSVSPDNDRNKSIKNDTNTNTNNNKPKLLKPKVREYKLQYCVYPGNNYKLIDKAMEHRNKDWEKVPTTYSEFCDLVWAPLSCNINFQDCEKKHQYVNHFEFNLEISNKMRLYANLFRHCEQKKIDIFSIFPFTISLQISHRSFNEQLHNFENLYNNINQYTPKGKRIFSDYFNVLLSKKIGSSQTINIPETFNNGKNLWIIKPVNLNRGRFITVEKNLSQIKKKVEEIQSKKKIFVDEKRKGGDIKCEYLILQKYLEKPLLYQGRKFDIRLWVLLIYDQEDNIYIFKQGHLKATCTQYDPESNDLFVHLTNYSVQKYNENFSKVEIGNEIPFKSFQDELDKNNTGINFYKDIYPKIVRIVRITGGAAKGKINFLNKKYCFEIFGYDFILDENYQPYLLEINTNPGLEISSPLIDELLPRMVDDALKLTIDKEFTKSYKYANEESLFPVTGYDNKENMWEKFSII